MKKEYIPFVEKLIELAVAEDIGDGDHTSLASIPADPAVRNFSYAMLDGALYYRENSRMSPIEVSGSDYERLAGLIALRDCCHELIALQLDDYADSNIRAKQQ